jgi:hypothetical protein
MVETLRQHIETLPIKLACEDLREKHSDVEFDYAIDLEIESDTARVYTVSHRNLMQDKTTVYRVKVYSEPRFFAMSFLSAIPGIPSMIDVNSVSDLVLALNDIYNSKTLLKMMGVS